MTECYFCGEEREDWDVEVDEPCKCGSWDWVDVDSRDRELGYTYGSGELVFNNIDNILEDKRNGTYRYKFE